MRRVAALTLTTVFLFNTMGYYFVFSYSQHLFRSEMKRCIRAGCFEKACVVLKIKNPSKNTEFQRINKCEFRYRNHLYDVVSEYRDGEFTVFRCINDQKEERLLAGFHRFIEFNIIRHNPVKARHALALQHLLVKLALISLHRSFPPEIPLKIVYSQKTYLLTAVFYPPPSPPPRHA